jgi:DNA replication protein DnaC
MWAGHSGTPRCTAASPPAIWTPKGLNPTRRGADEDTSLAQGTRGWDLFGGTVIDAGTGKTFFLEALGQKVIEAGMPVAWFTLEQIGVLVRAHHADGSLGKAVAKIVRAELVVIDDVGLLPVGADAAEGLYRIVEAAYEHSSVAISSNLHPSGFDELMPKTLATATVDRLLHHAHLCQTRICP